MSLSYGFCLGAEGTQYNSAQFSEAIHAFTGDGICSYGSEFSLNFGSGFSATLGSGYALVNGRWIENNDLYPLTFPLPNNSADRFDAVAATADYETKTVTPQVLVGIDPDALREDMSPLRNERSYSILLYLIRVRRGAPALREDDIEDVRSDSVFCGYVLPIHQIALKILEIYSFFSGGIDDEIERILGLSDAAVQRGSKAIEEMDAAILRKNGIEVGDVVVSLRQPRPSSEWLWCNGGIVPQEYPNLKDKIGQYLPEIMHKDSRFKSYIYAGSPFKEEDPYYRYRPFGSSAYLTADNRIYCCVR